MSFSDEDEIKRLLKEVSFYNVPIEKGNNVDMLRDLPFYEELNIVKTVEAFKKYARSYSIEIMKDKDRNMNDPLAQFEASETVIKDLFRDLLI